MCKSLAVREPVNTWTHFSMFVAGIVGLVFLILAARGSGTAVATAAIFGSSIIVLYGASSTYHWLHVKEKALGWLRRVDHMAIYLLIAGTYTPILVHGLEGAWRGASLSVIWSLALVGIVLKIWFIQAPRYLTASLYMAMGWMALIPLSQLARSFDPPMIYLLLAGGAMYTLGALIYASKRLNFWPKSFGFHEVFHIFVMAGTLVHYFMVYFFVLPRS